MSTREVSRLANPLVSFLCSLLPGDSGSRSLPQLSTQDLCAHREASVTSLTSKKYILRFPALETLMLDDNKLSNPNCFASLAGLRRYCHCLPHHCSQPLWGSHPEGCIQATQHRVRSQLHHVTLLCSLGQVRSLSLTWQRRATSVRLYPSGVGLAIAQDRFLTLKPRHPHPHTNPHKLYT